MSAYIVILIGLSAAVVLIGIYGYIDYMSDRHVSDMYTGLRDMMESIKVRLRILEDKVEEMNKTGVKLDRMENEYKSPISETKKTVISEPMNIIADKEIKL